MVNLRKKIPLSLHFPTPFVGEVRDGVGIVSKMSLCCPMGRFCAVYGQTQTSYSVEQLYCYLKPQKNNWRTTDLDTLVFCIEHTFGVHSLGWVYALEKWTSRYVNAHWVINTTQMIKCSLLENIASDLFVWGGRHGDSSFSLTSLIWIPHVQ